MAFSAADSVKPVSVAADRQIFAVPPPLEGALEVAALEFEVTVHIAGTVFFISVLVSRVIAKKNKKLSYWGGRLSEGEPNTVKVMLYPLLEGTAASFHVTIAIQCVGVDER